MMQTRHSAPRIAAPSPAISSPAALSLRASESEALCDLQLLDTRGNAVTEPKCAGVKKDIGEKKGSRLVDGVLGLASLVGERDGEEKWEEERQQVVAKSIPVKQKSHKTVSLRRSKPSLRRPPKSSQSHWPYLHAECFSHCKLRAEPAVLSHTWELCLKRLAPGGATRGSPPSAKPDLPCKSTIHVSIAFFIQSDLQGDKGEFAL